MRKYIDIISESILENEDDYRGQHQAADHDGGAPLYDLTVNGIYPKDIYGPRGYEYAFEDRTAFAIAMSYRGRPNKFITIYRAVPKDLKGAKINPGDWVTINRAYAKEHGESSLNNSYRIISMTVSARDVYTDGNSLEEWGYDPQPLVPRAVENEIRARFGMPTVEDARAAHQASIRAKRAALAPEEPLDDH